jgi:hypothetical protein
MKIDRDNPNAARVRDLKFDSVRKHCLSLAPPKERQVMQGDAKDTPAPHYLTFVNNFSKWHRQVQIGQARLPPPEILRQQLAPTLRRISELCGRNWCVRFNFLWPCSAAATRDKSRAFIGWDFERSRKLRASFSPEKSREPKCATAPEVPVPEAAAGGCESQALFTTEKNSVTNPAHAITFPPRYASKRAVISGIRAGSGRRGRFNQSRCSARKHKNLISDPVVVQRLFPGLLFTHP